MHLTYLSKAARGLGREDEAIEAERELAELTASDPRFAALDARLAAMLKGEAPKDNAERLALAQRAYDTQRYATASRLWAGALEADPKLADDRQAQHRYNAACAAALAGCGKGKDDPLPDDASKVKLRRQALDWLKAELAAWSKILESGPPQSRPVVAVDPRALEGRHRPRRHSRRCRVSQAAPRGTRRVQTALGRRRSAADQGRGPQVTG